jgi:CheY-like chemotaxis protein
VLVGCRPRSDKIRIEIWDTGPGIPADQRQSVFGEFYRLEASKRDGKTGLGLGLAIVDRLCRLLGHRIEVDSVVGKGSCFSVSVLAAAPAIEVAPARRPRRSRADTAGKLVVVIDDDPLVRDGMSGLLRSWGCEVLTAETATAASAGLAARKHAPDLIVSDYHLPDGKLGIEVIGELRASLAAEIPAFLMSGDTDAVHQRRAIASGLRLLHKPIDPMALRAMCIQVLATHDRAATL